MSARDLVERPGLIDEIVKVSRAYLFDDEHSYSLHFF